MSVLPEICVIECGEATFTVEDREITASVGQTFIAPANKPASVSEHRLDVVPLDQRGAER